MGVVTARFFFIYAKHDCHISFISSYVIALSESMGSGHGSGSRLPVVTTVTFTFAFFVLGPSDMLMGVATSVETLVGEGS